MQAKAAERRIGDCFNAQGINNSLGVSDFANDSLGVDTVAVQAKAAERRHRSLGVRDDGHGADSEHANTASLSVCNGIAAERIGFFNAQGQQQQLEDQLQQLEDQLQQMHQQWQEQWDLMF